MKKINTCMTILATLLLLGFVSNSWAQVCGDGEPDINEQCDDGNTTGGDGCSAVCAVEDGFVCTDAIAGTPPNTPPIPSACSNPGALWNVRKYWNRGGGGPVNVTLNCDGIAPVSGVANPGVTTQLVATGWEEGNTSCIVVEDIPNGTFEEYTIDCEVNNVISGTTYYCEIGNSEAFAEFSVVTSFMDGNDNIPVTLHMDCTNGTEQQVTTIPGTGAPDPGTYEVNFEVANFTPGVTDCTVYEEPLARYTPSYECGSTTNRDQVCMVGDPSPLDDYGDGPCFFEDLDSPGAYDSLNFCTIRNYRNPVKYSVPILNQYSMAVLLLLMMGVGMVGFRRTS